MVAAAAQSPFALLLLSLPCVAVVAITAAAAQLPFALLLLTAVVATFAAAAHSLFALLLLLLSLLWLQPLELMRSHHLLFFF